MSLTPDQRRRFLDEGYLLVPRAFAPDEIALLRRELAAIFSTKASYEGDYDDRATLGSVRFDICVRYPQLRWVLAHPAMISALKSLLGEQFLFLPEMSAHKGGYGDWHKDTTSQERAGETFQWSPTFAMVEAAIYLQDNAAWGGGLDVVPGSHTKADRYASGRGALEEIRARLERRRLLPFHRGVTIPSRAGDLVLFDFRIDHKASWPRRRGTPPPAYQKFALFFACSADNEHARRYVTYLHSRPEYAYFADRSYPDELRKVVEQGGARLFE